MFGKGIFGEMFDLYRDGKLDAGERTEFFEDNGLDADNYYI